MVGPAQHEDVVAAPGNHCVCAKLHLGAGAVEDFPWHGCVSAGAVVAGWVFGAVFSVPLVEDVEDALGERSLGVGIGLRDYGYGVWCFAFEKSFCIGCCQTKGASMVS